MTPAPAKTRVISLADLAKHPTGSLSPNDYIYVSGDVVLYDGDEHLVVRQEENELWLSRIEFVPGSKTIFSCSVPCGPTTTIFAVKRPKR